MRAVGSFLLRLVWPARCVACAAVSDEDAPFCPTCAISVLPLVGACPRCALVHDAEVAGGVDACAEGPGPFPFAGAAAPLVYGGSVADAIVRFKHGRRPVAGRALGRLLGPTLAWAAGQGAELALPVPLHPRRLRSRGFNQALELLREAEAWRRRSRGDRLHILVDTLRRDRDTPALGHESPATRRERVAGAFRVARPAAVAGRRIVVIDDVMTTGATLAECSRTLLEAGATSVVVVALARAFKSAESPLTPSPRPLTYAV